MLPADVVGAVVDQWQRVNRQIARIPDRDFARATRLGWWRVAELVAHTTSNMELVVASCRRPAPAKAGGRALAWYNNSSEFADAIDEQARQAARERPADLRTAHARTLDAAVALLSTSDPARVVAAGPDGLTLEQLCVTRCVEAVVHGMDLAHSLGRSADIGPGALDFCIRFFAALLVRSSSPPLARMVVEDVASASTWLVKWGPVTEEPRGTPRCDAITFLDLATGRIKLDRGLMTDLLDPQSHRRLCEHLPLLR